MLVIQNIPHFSLYKCISLLHKILYYPGIMSWDSYIDNLIAQTKDAAGAPHADRVAILGLDGGASWTTTKARK